MATDYDAPRQTDSDEPAHDVIEELRAHRAEAQSSSVDVDDIAAAWSPELPGADLSGLSGEEVTMRVVPKRDDEFTCASCFLVHHRSRLARRTARNLLCKDCT